MCNNSNLGSFLLGGGGNTTYMPKYKIFEILEDYTRNHDIHVFDQLLINQWISRCDITSMMASWSNTDILLYYRLIRSVANHGLKHHENRTAWHVLIGLSDALGSEVNQYQPLVSHSALMIS